VFDVAKHGSLRSFIDSQTEHPGIDKGLPKRDSSLRAGMQAGKDGKLGGVEGRIVARAVSRGDRGVEALTEEPRRRIRLVPGESATQRPARRSAGPVSGSPPTAGSGGDDATDDRA
jgi:hypothetical protein